MTVPDIPTVVLDFLIRLGKIDKRKLTVRDILILYTIIRNPGIAGNDLAAKLGIGNRSGIAGQIMRLERGGYIEDHRLERRKANPTLLHVTQRGLDFWEEIKP